MELDLLEINYSLKAGFSNHTLEKGPLPIQGMATVLMRNTLEKAVASIRESLTEERSPPYTSIDPVSEVPTDRLYFGMLWTVIHKVSEQGKLHEMIQQRRVDISNIKEHWREQVLKATVGLEASFYERISQLIKEGGKFKRVDEGAGSAYFLVDSCGRPCFVVKPIDEDIFCLNNRKGLATPFNQREFRVRDEIPLYRSAQTDVLAYQVADILGIGDITPKTVMAIFSSDDFYDLSDRLEGEEREEFLRLAGAVDKEKLCSIQEFVPESFELYDILQEWHHAGLSEEDVKAMLDQNDVEDCNLLIWTTYDNDAHGGNFRVYLKKIDENGRKIYGLKKVDNGLAFPEKNHLLINWLAFLPHGREKLSESLKKKIAAIAKDRIIEKLKAFEMEACIPAFIERVEVLKILSQRENMTASELNARMFLLSRENGKELALSNLSLQELEKLIDGDQTLAPSGDKS